MCEITTRSRDSRSGCSAAMNCRITRLRRDATKQEERFVTTRLKRQWIKQQGSHRKGFFSARKTQTGFWDTTEGLEEEGGGERTDVDESKATWSATYEASVFKEDKCFSQRDGTVVRDSVWLGTAHIHQELLGTFPNDLSQWQINKKISYSTHQCDVVWDVVN